MSNLVVLLQRLYGEMQGNPQNWGVLGPAPLRWKRGWSTRNTLLHHVLSCRIRSFYGKRYDRY